MTIEKATVAIGVTDDFPACEKQAALDGRKGIGGGLLGMAFALQEATKGGRREGRIDR